MRFKQYFIDYIFKYLAIQTFQTNWHRLNVFSCQIKVEEPAKTTEIIFQHVQYVHKQTSEHKIT